MGGYAWAMLRLIVWALLLVAGIGGDSRAGPDLRVFDSEHYEIRSDAEPDTVREIAAHMDLIFEDYARRFREFRVRDSRAFPLWVFETREDYLVFLAEQGFNGQGTGGVFFRGRDGAGLATFLESRPIDTVLGTLRHEGLHQFAYARISQHLPPWLNEGMAEFFNHAIVTEGAIDPGVVDPGALHRVVSSIESGAYLPMETLLTLTAESWGDRLRAGGPASRAMYDQSWAVVHFMINAERGRFEPLLLELLREAARGQADLRIPEKFGVDLTPMEEAWKRYIRDAEPEPVLVAVERLSVMAWVMKTLVEAGERPLSLDALREAVAEREFSGRYPSASGVRDVNAEEDWWLELPEGDRQRKARLVVKNTASGVGLPSMEVHGLEHVVSVQWVDSEPGYRVVVQDKRARRRSSSR